ncbi:PREDICTED: unnamed product [Prunus dulcis]|uniref:PREDICTED: unnamed product n=1 Tax=Prunus dulcis TaxID=3755 RepID=A0A5E4FZW5_PRUDU|nr:PREDICTED: unnamed product [Prunus dulcis]
MKNGVLIIQTLRNNIMASSLLATTAITLSSVISVFVSTSSSSSSDSTSTKYFAHASFLATLPTRKDKTDYIEYVSTTVNRGSYFWSLGLRAFYL